MDNQDTAVADSLIVVSEWLLQKQKKTEEHKNEDFDSDEEEEEEVRINV